MLREIVALYRQSRKPHDIFWNTYVSRPLAAVLVYLLARTPSTPNQVTFLSLAVAGVGVAGLVVWPSPIGLLAASLILQLSYVLDCADGQLARYQNRTTPVGAHLDFLMDELKAYAVFGATAVRLWRITQDLKFLWLGIAGLAILASAISLTTFMRRPEYAPPPPPTGFAPPAARPRTLAGWLATLVERIARYIAHYPSYFIWLALLDRMDLYLQAYTVVHLLYLVRSMAQIMLRLGTPSGGAPA